MVKNHRGQQEISNWNYQEFTLWDNGFAYLTGWTRISMKERYLSQSCKSCQKKEKSKIANRKPVLSEVEWIINSKPAIRKHKSSKNVPLVGRAYNFNYTDHDTPSSRSATQTLMIDCYGASACNFKPSAEITFRIVSNDGILSPDRAL